MTRRPAFSIHGDILRYRGDDVAQLLHTPYLSITADFLAALACTEDIEIDTLEQDITNLLAELDFLRLEVAKALKFLAVADILTACELLERIIIDTDNP